MAITPQQKQHFDVLGFVVVPGALTPEQIDAYGRRFDTVAEQVQDDRTDAGHRIFPDGHRVIVPLIEADPYFYTLLDDAALLDIADGLLGEDCIFNGSSDGQIHSGDTNWHRDGRVPEPTVQAKITFYLDDVAPGRGCLSFIPGSHRWPLEFRDLEADVDQRMLGYRAPDFPGRHDQPSRKGDVIAFNTRTWHSSWGGGARRRQMAWMMETAVTSPADVDRLTELYSVNVEQWAPKTRRLVSDRFFETAGERRRQKIEVVREIDRRVAGSVS